MNALSVNIKCLLHIAFITFIALHTQTIKANKDSLKYAKDYAKAKQYLTEGKKQKALKSLSKLVSENTFRPEASL